MEKSETDYFKPLFDRLESMEGEDPFSGRKNVYHDAPSDGGRKSGSQGSPQGLAWGVVIVRGPRFLRTLRPPNSYFSRF